MCGLFLFKRNFTSDKVEGEVILHSFSQHFFFEVFIFNASYFINVVMMHGQDKSDYYLKSRSFPRQLTQSQITTFKPCTSRKTLTVFSLVQCPLVYKMNEFFAFRRKQKKQNKKKPVNSSFGCRVTKDCQSRCLLSRLHNSWIIQKLKRK